MSRVVVRLIAALWILSADVSADQPASPNAADDGFVSLYNGKDLSGWEVREGQRKAWQANGELLSCSAVGGGWLRTSKMYSDFILKLEYRILPDGDGGVGVRIPKQGNPVHTGMKIQIVDDGSPMNKDLPPAEYTGAIFDQAAPKRGASKPAGEWNEFEITCLGPQIRVVLNGEVVNDVLADRITKGESGHLPLSDRPGIGFIGLQGCGSRIDFRTLAVKDLTATTRSGVSYVDLSVGKGSVVSHRSTVVVHYTGRLADGAKFDSSYDHDPPRPSALALEDVIPGWQEGIPGMCAGGRRKLVIPPGLAYGDRCATRFLQILYSFSTSKCWRSGKWNFPSKNARRAGRWSWETSRRARPVANPCRLLKAL